MYAIIGIILLIFTFFSLIIIYNKSASIIIACQFKQSTQYNSTVKEHMK